MFQAVNFIQPNCAALAQTNKFRVGIRSLAGIAGWKKIGAGWTSTRGGGVRSTPAEKKILTQNENVQSRNLLERAAQLNFPINLYFFYKIL